MDRPSADSEKGLARSHDENYSSPQQSIDTLAKEYAIASSSVGIAMADLKGKLFYANAAFLRTLGVENSKDIIGKKVLDIASNKEIAAKGLKAVKESGSWSTDVIRRMDGKSFNERIVANVVTDASGQPCCMMACILDMTEHIRMEEVLHESEEKFRTLTELSPYMIYIMNMDGLIYINKKCEEVMGCTREEAYSPDFDFMSFVAPEYRDTIAGVFSAHRNNNEEPPLEFALITRDGKRIDAILNTRLITFDGEKAAMGTVIDVTRLKETEKELRQLNERLGLAYDASGAGAWDWDITSDHIEWSPKMFELLGLNSQQTTASFEAWETVLHPEDREGATSGMNRALEEHIPLINESRVVLPNGQIRWINALGKGIYDENNQPVRMIGICIDITDHKKIEELKDEFIGMVSHELRTPLTVIMGSLRVAQSQGISAEEINALLKEATLSSEDLSHILENLIELSRYQSNRLTLNKDRINIASFVREFARVNAGFINEHKLSLDISEGLPDVEVDKVRIQQILHNLIENAAKYSPANTEIGISVNQKKENIVIAVSDQGKGISPEDQSRLFEPFERLEENLSTRPGLGLGLLVCRRLVEAHGGKIWVESEPGKGSTFYFNLLLDSTSLP
jgi:two-component system sensor histidine kinase VicK